ncbi:MAG: cytochrome-c peroxidase [Planctomycetaceae bacterium]|nr:cytochrome-c peroxidase [Planctomycetaceae bacterium]
MLLLGTALLFVVSPLQADHHLPPKGLKPLKYPKDNPQTAAKIELGKQLYFDPRLSSDDTVSCASCHDPKKGYSNGERFGIGVDGKEGGRNTPTIINMAYSRMQFWDGRVYSRTASLEAQALGPIANPIEMNLPLDKMEIKLNKIEGYRKQFKAVFGADKIVKEDVAKAIAAFERTILSGDAPYDRFKAGDEKALSAAAKRGMDLFFSGKKTNCVACHKGERFRDDAFHNIGVGMDAKKPDVGRFAVTKLEGDRGRFKTPPLREVDKNGPYMHDGSLKTLEEVVEFYAKGGIKNPQLSEDIKPLKLTKQEKADLVTFMKEGLSSKKYPMVKAPKLPK